MRQDKIKINILHNLLILLPMHGFKLQILNHGDLFPVNKPFQGMALADCPLKVLACLLAFLLSLPACLLAFCFLIVVVQILYWPCQPCQSILC